MPKTIQIDSTSYAVWDRYLPHFANDEDWQSYSSFKGPFQDSLSKRIRLLSLASLVRNVTVPGIFAECGCFQGHSTHVILSSMSEAHKNERMVVFDSFEGLSQPNEEDYEVPPGNRDLYNVQASLRKGGKMFASSLVKTMNNLAEHKNVEYVPGWIPDSFSQFSDETFAFVHIDVDLFQPTLDSLEFFWPRLSDGGIIQVDDYNFTDWPGATKAVDKFLAKHSPQIFYSIPLGGAYLVK